MRLVVTLVVLLAWFLAAGGHDLLEDGHDHHDEATALYAALIRTASPVASAANDGFQIPAAAVSPLILSAPTLLDLVIDRATVPRRGPPLHPSSGTRAPPAVS